jgi:uncharacterized protein (DUF362 family)
MINTSFSRRKFIGAVGAATGAWLARPLMSLANTAPASRVAIGQCHSYATPEVVDALARMFDQLGGLTKLVGGKTVAIKVNLTGGATERIDYQPVGVTHWTHPDVLGATIHLLGKAGARRIRLLESPQATAEPLDEFMLEAGWNPQEFTSAATKVEFENTNYLGWGKKYSHFIVPGGGLMFDSYYLNHSYEDCDVFVSVSKMKEHGTTGMTCSMKNCFGITPCTIYGEKAPKDEPAILPTSGRASLHNGNRQPAAPAPPEINPSSPREGGYRVPRIVVDLVSARPIHLAVLDGIETIAGGEGPWNTKHKLIKPGVLVAGMNCVSTDAVCAEIMGFDPMAARGTAPFETADSMLQLAEQKGLGTRDLKRIEVVGTPISKVRFNIRTA